MNSSPIDMERFSDAQNHFFNILDRECLKDAIRRHDLALLRERERFLSAENIEECIRFAQAEKVGECEAWLISKRK